MLTGGSSRRLQAIKIIRRKGGESSTTRKRAAIVAAGDKSHPEERAMLIGHARRNWLLFASPQYSMKSVLMT
jgi:hypothetical protein